VFDLTVAGVTRPTEEDPPLLTPPRGPSAPDFNGVFSDLERRGCDFAFNSKIKSSFYKIYCGFVNSAVLIMCFELIYEVSRHNLVFSKNIFEVPHLYDDRNFYLAAAALTVKSWKELVTCSKNQARDQGNTTSAQERQVCDILP
jgi:hypothetical protein